MPEEPDPTTNTTEFARGLKNEDSEYGGFLGKVNYSLLRAFAAAPHPSQREDVDTSDVHAGWLEIAQEAKVSHHLLDIVKVPTGLPQGEGDLDARTYRLVTEFIALQERLGRIADWHSRETGPAGTVGDNCNECGHSWPCDTQKMAEGTYVDDEE